MATSRGRMLVVGLFSASLHLAAILRDAIRRAPRQAAGRVREQHRRELGSKAAASTEEPAEVDSRP